MSSGGCLERAHFATTARLISSLVIESLVDAFYLPISSEGATGFAVILTTEESAHVGIVDRILCIIPLHHPPIFRDEERTSFGKKIGLLDPLDMIPMSFVVGINSVSEFLIQDDNVLISPLLGAFRSVMGLQLNKDAIYKMNDPHVLWHRFCSSLQLDDNIEKEVADEFANSIQWQTYSYEHPPQAPEITSPSIEWQQSIVEGHPLYPMYHLRGFCPPLPKYAPGEYDFLRPKLRFVSFFREELKITYDFENLISPLLHTAEARAGTPFNVEKTRVIIPVHELQIHYIREKFGTAIIYPEEFNLPLLAQQSLRSVVIPEGFPGLQLKLALSVKLSSGLRTIPPQEAHFNPRFSFQVVPSLTMNHDIITLGKEIASVIHSTPDDDVARHCAVIVREYHEDRSEECGERLIVCTSLVESGHAGTDGGTPSVIRVFELDTEEKRLQWLEKFVSIFLQAVLPPILCNGVAFECHPQNCVARFDVQSKELKGFIIQDFGGLRIHPPTLKATTGLDLDDFMPPNYSVRAKTLDEVYSRSYHTIVHNHLQRLIRVLQLHYNGLGWKVVREQLSKNIPIDHPLYDAWLSPSRRTVPGKAFMVMRIASVNKPWIILHRPFPNLIHYTGTDEKD